MPILSDWWIQMCDFKECCHVFMAGNYCFQRTEAAILKAFVFDDFIFGAGRLV